MNCLSVLDHIVWLSFKGSIILKAGFGDDPYEWSPWKVVYFSCVYFVFLNNINPKKKILTTLTFVTGTKHLSATYIFSTCQLGNHMFKVNSRNTRARCEIGSKSTIKTPERRQWDLYCWLWTYFTACSSVSIVNF